MRCSFLVASWSRQSHPWLQTPQLTVVLILFFWLDLGPLSLGHAFEFSPPHVATRIKRNKKFSFPVAPTRLNSVSQLHCSVPHVAGGCSIEQHRQKTFPSLKKVLLNGVGLIKVQDSVGLDSVLSSDLFTLSPLIYSQGVGSHCLVCPTPQSHFSGNCYSILHLASTYLSSQYYNGYTDVHT